ncbi:hypothetical protein ACROYT_G019680 [Oculina patagonica]
MFTVIKYVINLSNRCHLVLGNLIGDLIRFVPQLEDTNAMLIPAPEQPKDKGPWMMVHVKRPRPAELAEDGTRLPTNDPDLCQMHDGLNHSGAKSPASVWEHERKCRRQERLRTKEVAACARRCKRRYLAGTMTKCGYWMKPGYKEPLGTYNAT